MHVVVFATLVWRRAPGSCLIQDSLILSWLGGSCSIGTRVHTGSRPSGDPVSRWWDHDADTLDLVCGVLISSDWWSGWHPWGVRRLTPGHSMGPGMPHSALTTNGQVLWPAFFAQFTTFQRTRTRLTTARQRARCPLWVCLDQNQGHIGKL